ncbi:unnamed protein product [Bracoviriform congregatae]|uniref:Uncharacterized protein n=1 Tax=Bracoviriform congregatae TaxID=39640 RepID=Q5ZNU6_9VIRU|nr:unnamed protein product [Bracoviriform congregatae]CAG18433.1 unnamed protein product [Bracoviriform congregatae]
MALLAINHKLFVGCIKMSKHVCLVPKEWSNKYYSQDVLETVLKKDISCYSITKKVEGAKINVNGTTAQLRYHGDQPWMRKEQDKRTFPNPREYFGVYMSCNDCRKPPQKLGDLSELTFDSECVYFVSGTCHIADKVGTSEFTCKSYECH